MRRSDVTPQPGEVWRRKDQPLRTAKVICVRQQGVEFEPLTDALGRKPERVRRFLVPFPGWGSYPWEPVVEDEVELSKEGKVVERWPNGEPKVVVAPDGTHMLHLPTPRLDLLDRIVDAQVSALDATGGDLNAALEASRLASLEFEGHPVVEPLPREVGA